MSKKNVLGQITPLFVTEIYRADLSTESGFIPFLEELDDTCRAIADEDEMGHHWSEAKGYLGYTSYASLNDLPIRASIFADLKAKLDHHVAAYCDLIEFDLGGKKLKLDNLWINILEPFGMHSNHIHPHSVVSGTLYVSTPEGVGALKYEDPRLDRFMNAPARKTDAEQTRQTFVSMALAPGTLLLWESWLRHEVPINQSEDVRISISFNYDWG